MTEQCPCGFGAMHSDGCLFSCDYTHEICQKKIKENADRLRSITGRLAPTCQHCGESAPYGDQRNQWISIHIGSVIHRLWWQLKKSYRRRFK